MDGCGHRRQSAREASCAPRGPATTGFGSSAGAGSTRARTRCHAAAHGSRAAAPRAPAWLGLGLGLRLGLGLCRKVDTKVAQASAGWRSGGLSQRPFMPQAAPSFGQPRASSRLGRARPNPGGPRSRQRLGPAGGCEGAKRLDDLGLATAARGGVGERHVVGARRRVHTAARVHAGDHLGHGQLTTRASSVRHWPGWRWCGWRWCGCRAHHTSEGKGDVAGKEGAKRLAELDVCDRRHGRARRSTLAPAARPAKLLAPSWHALQRVRVR